MPDYPEKELTDDELLEALGVTPEPEQTGGHTPREERIIAGFEDIQRFFETHGRAPQHGETRDIFERLYAMRLDRLRALPEARALLASSDTHHLLDASASADASAAHVKPEAIDDDTLLAELGAGSDAAPGKDDITTLRHVRPAEERRLAEEIASRTPCKDFDRFKPLFEKVESELRAGLRKALPFHVENETRVNAGQFFILGGQIAYVARKGEPLKLSEGKSDARLRVIFSNGTESDLLMRSLQRALYKDEAGRRITDVEVGPLFSGAWEEADIESGTIYVLRSKSTHPYVCANRAILHKIGVTGGKVETRIANAAHEATYLLADVEIVATYKLSQRINRIKLEGILHRVFASAQLDLEIKDRFNNPVRPKEWYLVPLQVIDEAVTRIIDGSITSMIYDAKTARLVAQPE